MKKLLILHIVLLSSCYAYSNFEFGINYTSGITKTYNHTIYNVNIAPSFKSYNYYKYLWGVLFDFKIYNRTYISIGAEHKAMYVGASQKYNTSDITIDKFGVYGMETYYRIGWGYWTFPIRFSYKQPIYKGIYISPNFGFSYIYNLSLFNYLSCDNNGLSYNDTALFSFNLCEKDFINLNKHLFQIQLGAEFGYTHNFFSVYLGTNYSKGLNKMFLYKLQSTEKDIYANTPIKKYHADIYSRGTNINFYLGMRFQLYPILKVKKKKNI